MCRRASIITIILLPAVGGATLCYRRLIDPPKGKSAVAFLYRISGDSAFWRSQFYAPWKSMENCPWKSFHGISIEYFPWNSTWAETRRLHGDYTEFHVEYSVESPRNATGLYGVFIMFFSCAETFFSMEIQWNDIRG